MSRVATVGITTTLDLAPARNEFDRWVKDVQAKGLHVPLSIAPGGAGAAPATTLGGGNLGTFTPGLASPNLGYQFGRLEQALNAVTAALGRIGGGGGPGGRGRRMGQDEAASVFGPMAEGATPENEPSRYRKAQGEKLRHRAYEYAHLFDQSQGEQKEGDAAARRQNIIDRTRDTYKNDPASDLNDAIAEAADLERLSYPDRAPGRTGRGGAPRGGGGRQRDVFGRLLSHLGGAYAVYTGVSAVMQYGQSMGSELVAERSGDPAAVLRAQQHTYQSGVASFGFLGSAFDILSAGSFSIESDNLQIERQHAKEQLNANRVAAPSSLAVSLNREGRAQQLAGVRNNYDRNDLEIRGAYKSRVDEFYAEDARQRANLPLISDPAKYNTAVKEHNDYVHNQNRVIYAALQTTNRELGRNAEDRRFDQTGRDIQYSTSIQQNRASAANSPFGATFADIIGQTQGAMNNARSKDNPQDLGKILAVGISQGMEAMSSLARGNMLSAMGIEGGTAAMALRLNGDELGARKSAIESRRRQEQAALPTSGGFYGNLFDLLGGSRLRSAIDARAAADTYETVRDYNHEGRMIGLRQDFTRRQLDARLNRDPTGAEVLNVIAGAEGRANELQFAHRTDAGKNELNLGIKELELIKQTYRDSFRGTALDLRHFDVSNPRDKEDPVAVLKTINTGIQELKTAITNLTDNDD